MTTLIGAQYGTISDIEIVWVTIAVIGLFLAIWNFKNALSDKRALKVANIKNGRTILARANLLSEATRIVIQSIFVGIGIGAMTLADPPDQLDLPLRQTIISALVRWGILIAAALLVFNSGIARWVRGQLQHQVEKDLLEREKLDLAASTTLEESRNETAVLRIENAELVGEAKIETIQDSERQ